MSRLIHIICLICTILIWALPISAQDVEKSYLESLLESSLSSPGMQVSVNGLDGALSSSAKIESIEFSDASGIWLSIENAELDWTRSALLKKQIKAQTLSAEKITLFRKPATGTQSTSANADIFRVPELPVSVNIQNITAKELILEEPVFGITTRLQLDGSINIAAGNMDVTLKAQNLDNPGIFDLKTILSGKGEAIFVHLNATEEANGLIANMLDIPGKPSVSVAIDGKGTYTALITDMRIKTDGSDRLNGQVILSPNTDDNYPGGIQLSVDLKGNLTPFLKNKYQGFFGDSSYLKAVAKLPDSGKIIVSGLNLQTEALTVKGALALAADHSPEHVSLVSRIVSATGSPLLLPMKGPETSIQAAKLTLNYDINQPWFGALQIWDLSRDGLSVESLHMNISGESTGEIPVAAATDLQFTAFIDAAANSVSHNNTDLDHAIGEDIRASGKVTFKKDKPVIISGLTFSDGNISAGFDGEVADLNSALLTTGKLYAQVNDLSAVSKLTGQDLQGKTTLSAKGDVALLSGAFDLDIEATGSSLSLGNSAISPLIAGENSASVSMQRTQDGLFIEKLNFANPQLSVDANGQMQNEQISADITAAINNLGVISDALSGPLKSEGSLQQSGDNLLVDFKTTGAGGLQADVKGTVPVNDGAWDLTVNGQAPLAFADSVMASSSIRARGDILFDLALNGPPLLQNVTGEITTQNASVAMPAQRLSLQNITASARLADGVTNSRISADLSTGGQILGEGQISLNQEQGLPADLKLQLINITQEDPLFYKTTINGDLALSGPLLSGPKLSGKIDLTDTEVNVKGAANQNLSFIPEIVHKNEPAASFLTRKRAGLVITEAQETSQNRPINLDLLINAPSRIFIRGLGLDAELGGHLQLTGSTQSVVPVGSFDLIRGRLVILGKQLSLTEGNITMAGALDPMIRVVATNDSGGYRTSVIISGLVSDPQFSFESSPELPEDEVLSQMLFGSGLDDISPFQALQLASALRELSGKGGPGLGGNLRSKLSLDDLSVGTDADGDTGLRAGKYISEKVYTDVNIMGDGKSEISINLDLNKSLSTKGSVSESGGSKFGFVFKKDY